MQMVKTVRLRSERQTHTSAAGFRVSRPPFGSGWPFGESSAVVVSGCEHSATGLTLATEPLPFAGQPYMFHDTPQRCGTTRATCRGSRTISASRTEPFDGSLHVLASTVHCSASRMNLAAQPLHLSRQPCTFRWRTSVRRQSPGCSLRNPIDVGHGSSSGPAHLGCDAGAIGPNSRVLSARRTLPVCM